MKPLPLLLLITTSLFFLNSCTVAKVASLPVKIANDAAHGVYGVTKATVKAVVPSGSED